MSRSMTSHTKLTVRMLSWQSCFSLGEKHGTGRDQMEWMDLVPSEKLGEGNMEINKVISREKTYVHAWCAHVNR